MRKYVATGLILLLFAVSCKKEGEIPTSGESRINSKLYFNSETQNYYSKGFRFSTGSLVKYEPFTAGVVPDLIIQPPPNLDTIIGAVLESPNNDDAFKQLGEFGNAQDAADFFESLDDLGTQTYTFWANPILPNEVWGIQTYDKKYAKIWIRSLDIKEDKDGNQYVEVLFRWAYQSDGTTVFTE